MILYYLECRSPLGMEDGRIKDSRITTTSYFNKAYGKLARLTKNISKCGAWCPNTCGIATDKKLKYDQHIIIELEDLKKITAIATQARCCTDNGRKDWMKHYKLSYRSEDDGNWVFYKGKDGSVKVSLIKIYSVKSLSLTGKMFSKVMLLFLECYILINILSQSSFSFDNLTG